ncbi:cytokine receptor-like isoform X1 [Diabrotica undecimpunctata]|uniref:cytokine receptor-like isoform X1 n=1 Tax=Diabrotica undecimpunctata TaxID=50387 RepID=UPI003B6343D9
MKLAPKLFLLLFSIVGGSSKEKNSTSKHLPKCVGIVSCGYTMPEGDITLKYGEPLQITCYIYDEYVEKYTNASSRLYFTRNKTIFDPNNGTVSSPHLPPISYNSSFITPYDKVDLNDETAPRIEILDERSIQLTIPKPEKTVKDFFACVLNTTELQMAACTNVVAVGVPPQEVKDFACVSENYEQLKCTWTAPENYLMTQYRLEYNFKSTKPRHKLKNGKRVRTSGTSLYKYMNKKSTQHHCPTYPITDTTSETVGVNLSCVWTVNSTPQYRQSKQMFKFTLRINNSLGERVQHFDFDHFKHMRPKPVERLFANATSPSSIILTWQYNSKLDGFIKPLEGEIRYTCQYCNQNWSLGGRFNTSNDRKTTKYELKNLEYPHTLYDIRVRIKPLEADEKMWSDFAVETKRTLSALPNSPPLVNQGSFQIEVNAMNSLTRDVYVYFQSVEEYEKNGENFTYEVIATPPLQIKELTKSYAKFEGLSEREYIIRIWSKNEVGRSIKHSEIIIPEHPLGEPEQFFKIERSFNTYELQWEPPSHHGLITNYTLFWCVNDRERPYQCKGYLDWVVLSNTTFKHNMTSNDHVILQFAVSANNDRSSSGMRWAECTVLANRTVGKMRNVWVNKVGPDFIELSWKLECSDILSEVTGFVITYCSSTSTLSKANECEGEVKNITRPGSLSTESARITNLTPYTTYLLAVSVKSTNTVSQRSDWCRNVTSPTAPSIPLNVTTSNVTNSSITVTWSPPDKLNGPLNAYIIRYNDKEKKVDAINRTNKEILNDLESYTKYVIYMRACTGNMCSENSENKTVVTKMGIPAKISRPYVNGNSDENIIRWDKPDPPRGDIDYYQLSITRDGFNMEEGSLKNVTNANNYTIENCRDAGLHTFFVAVRAVNNIDGEHVIAPWSDTVKIYCYRSSWYIFIYVFFGICGMLLIGYGLKKLYMCWNIARHVEIKLPPGLAPAVEHHNEKNMDIIERNFTHDPDEELLLERMNEKCQAVDSSGCSSGQESISSSVESTTHLSVDSGTDQPRNVSDDNKENSLRLRNVSSKGYVMYDPTPPVNRGTKPPPAPAGSYCLIGVDITPKPNPDTPYVTVSDVEQPVLSYGANEPLPEGPPPYVVTDIFKTTNPGYVPFTPMEPANKNTGYVVAGDLTSLPAPEAQKEFMVADPQVALKPTTVWQEPLLEPSSLPKPGYVSVGDALPPITVREAKGYVPHRHFEKTLKEE